MKKVLAVVLAAALLSVTAVGAFAQIPFVQWYFDANMTQTSTDCVDDGGAFHTGHVVAVNFNIFMSSVEYTISYPPSISWFADVSVNVNQLNIGATPLSLGGVASAWTLPLGTFTPTPIMRVLFKWVCPDGCYGIQPIEIGPHPTGRLSYVQFGNNVRRDAIGMISLVCPDPIPVEETSWGKVKALYEE